MKLTRDQEVEKLTEGTAKYFLERKKFHKLDKVVDWRWLQIEIRKALPIL